MKNLLFVLLVFSGCSAVQKNTSREYASAYREKDSIEHSLLDKDGNLGEQEIQKLLQSKVELPKKIHLAIVVLSEFSTWRSNLVTEGMEFLMRRESWGSRVSAVTPLPQILLGEKISLKSLRQTAALLQADALVVVKPMSRADWRYQLFSSTEAKSVSSSEVLLLDVRTSVIPFTALVTEIAEIEEINEDYSKQELLERAKMKAESQSQKKIATMVKSYLGGEL